MSEPDQKPHCNCGSRCQRPEPLLIDWEALGGPIQIDIGPDKAGDVTVVTSRIRCVTKGAKKEFSNRYSRRVDRYTCDPRWMAETIRLLLASIAQAQQKEKAEAGKERSCPTT